MNILVVGSGGREHALCWAFAKSSRVGKIFCTRGNAGIEAVAECVTIGVEDVAGLAAFANDRSIDLTFVGGESSLAAGIVDEFVARGLRIVGPTRSAARLESSKAFAKDFMLRHNIPTAAYEIADSPAAADSILRSGTFGSENSPVVVKADGLAAGKGVVVARDRSEAIAAIEELSAVAGAEAASRIVLEECLFGREISLLLFASGESFALMPAVRDHKRIGEGDTGPNTGGMGTITDAALISDEQRAEIVESVIRPTLCGCGSEGFAFQGVLFLGLMMTDSGPKLLEYNVRFGDPETQSLLVRLETDLVEVCEAVLAGGLDKLEVRWQPGSSATVVLAADGYPVSPRKGDRITGITDASSIPGVTLFHAGTARGPGGEVMTAGGRVLGVTATGDSLAAALETAYSAVARISWNGMQYRRDIGR